MSPEDNKAFDVFLSYSSTDKVRVRRLARRLEASGLRVWFDEWVIKPGDDIYLSVERGLSSARILVLCMSQSTFGSEWTGLERSTALFRDPCNLDRRFIPLLLAECDIPDALRRFRFIDYRREGRAAFEQLLVACESKKSRKQISGATPEYQLNLQLDRKLVGHTGWVWDLALSLDGRLLASGSADSKVRLWDLESNTCLATLTGHSGDVNCVAMSPDGTKVLSASDDHTIRVWDVSSQRCIRTIRTDDSRILSAAYSGGSRILSAGPDNSVRVWETPTGRLRKQLNGHRDTVWAVDVAPGDKRALSGGFDFEIRHWNLSSGRCLNVLSGHSNVVNSVQFTSDGQHAISGSDDRTVKVWDLRRGTCLHTLIGHERTVYSVAVAPHDSLVASTGFLDETVRLWDWKFGTCLQVLHNADHASPVSVMFSHDGQYLAVGTATPDAIYIYSIPKDVVDRLGQS